MSCLHTWEQDVVSLVAILTTKQDTTMVMVYKNLQPWGIKLLPKIHCISRIRTATLRPEECHS